jgi:hypothetical protein
MKIIKKVFLSLIFFLQTAYPAKPAPCNKIQRALVTLIGNVSNCLGTAWNFYCMVDTALGSPYIPYTDLAAQLPLAPTIGVATLTVAGYAAYRLRNKH